MKKNKLLPVSIFAVLLLSIAAIVMGLRVETVAEVEDISPTKTPITVYNPVTKGLVDIERTIGTIEPTATVNVASVVSGEVVRVHVGIGEQVNINAPILTIKTPNGQEVVVRSPISGRVATIMPQKGETIGAMMVAQVVNDSRLIAVTQVTSEQLKRIETLQPVKLYLDGNEGNMLNGYVGHINDVTSSRSGLYEVEVEIISATNTVSIGEFAFVDFIIDESDYVVVPKQVVQQREGTYSVFLVEGDQVVEQKVELGLEKDGEVAILKGIDMTSLVASLGNQYLEDGDMIEIVK